MSACYSRSRLAGWSTSTSTIHARSSWRTTRKGTTVGGRPFDKIMLYRLLRNPAYLGKVKHHDDLYEGEHDAIMDKAIWHRRRPYCGATVAPVAGS